MLESARKSALDIDKQYKISETVNGWVGGWLGTASGGGGAGNNNSSGNSPSGTSPLSANRPPSPAANTNATIIGSGSKPNSPNKQ